MALGSTAAGVAASLALGPEPRSALRVFYDRARPPGFWGPVAVEAEVRKHALSDQTYESRVSHYLITELSERQVFWLFLGAVVGLSLLGHYLGRRVPC